MDICPYYKRNNDVYGYCSGTKWNQTCVCQGNQSKCDYYPEKREKAKKMTTLEMMNLAKDNGKTYKCAYDMFYNNVLGFNDGKGHMRSGYDFTNINNLFDIDYWEEATLCMTKSEAEEKYGIKIIGD